ncbi:hypothetical protein FGRMN_4191 [Fusarium graminum]|nr:hypothetical protein FGRMN_4191 [Fusarium graminum]
MIYIGINTVRRALKAWTIKSQRASAEYDLATLADLERQIEEKDGVQFFWPEGGKDRWEWDGSSCRGYIFNAEPDKELSQPMFFHKPSEAQWRGIAVDQACGTFMQIYSNRQLNVIEYKDAIGILCFSEGNEDVLSFDLLGYHLSEWREHSAQRRVGLITSGSDKASTSSIWSTGTVYRMRCFVVDRPEEAVSRPTPAVPGLPCFREKVTFRVLYDDSKISLVEERYPMAVNMFALHHPMDSGPRSEKHILFEDVIHGTVKDQVPWQRYGIQIAGLCTGVSMFQFQICTFVDFWEKDWDKTMKRIDEMVVLKVKLSILNDKDRLKKLVLDSDDDAAVLYFQILQYLNFFSDSVRFTENSLCDLITESNAALFGSDWLHDKPNKTKEDTKKVLDHKWEIVKDLQHETSSKVPKRLERTTNPVKSLQSGVRMVCLSPRYGTL